MEPAHVAEAVAHLNLKHVVITSVTRDDLPIGGAGHFAKVIKSIRKNNDQIIVEVLIPDLNGESLRLVVDAKPQILNHNIETISRLYSEVRPLTSFRRSLELLREVKKMDRRIYTKSGIMLGLGEKEEEIIDLMKDLKEVDCDFFTVNTLPRRAIITL